MQPIRITSQPKKSIKILNITAYKKQLSKCQFPNLNKMPINSIDTVAENIINNIQQATDDICKTSHTKTIKTYEPTPLIKRKLQQYQVAMNNYIIYGVPNHEYLRTALLIIITTHKTNIWEAVVKAAVDNYGNPAQFWKTVKQLQGLPSKNNKILTTSSVNDDSEDSYFGEIITDNITDPQEQANLVSTTWEKIYHPHSDICFINRNTRRIRNWYENMVPSLLPDNIIDIDKLPPDHTLIRPIESIELKMAINFSKPNKAPGPSSITVLQLKYLPVNIMRAIRNLYDAMLVSKYFPNILLTINMLFFGKQNSDLTDPTNYRPISLLETLCKTLERIVTNRFTYFLEHHNLLSEFQFGFRKQRSAQQVITLACETIKQNSRQSKASLAATRDISKAFGTIWHAGLIYKLQSITNGCMHFIAFIHHYLTNRIITPIFNGKKGSSFNPKAGVPQGSVTGPLLFNIYVNDMPPPLYRDTVRPQFANDVLTIVRSDTRERNKYENVL